MSGLRLYGVSLLEALALLLARAAPEAVRLTLGPRELALRKILADLQPQLPVHMGAGDVGARTAYVTSTGHLPAGPFALCVVFGEPPAGTSPTGAHTLVVRTAADLAGAWHSFATAPAAGRTIYIGPNLGSAALDLTLRDERAAPPGDSRPRVLMLTPYLPWPPDSGGRIRISEELRCLSQHARLTLASIYSSYADLASAAQLGAWCETVILARAAPAPGAADLPRPVAEATSPHLARALAAELARGGFAAAHLQHCFMGAYADQLAGLPLIVEEQNLEHEVLERSGQPAEAARLEAFARRLWARAAQLVAVTERDAAAMRQAAPGVPVTVAPNGVDTHYFAPGPPAPAVRLVFVGTLHYPPNRAAVRFFCEEAWPALRGLGLTWHIVGSGALAGLDFAAADPQVQLHLNVPDVRPWLDENAIAVVPLQAGGGSRLKILTALARGCPVVSTPLGCEGLDVRDGEQLFVAAGTAGLVERIGALAADPALRRRLGQAGRAWVLAHHQWAQVLRPLSDVYAALTRDPHPA